MADIFDEINDDLRHERMRSAARRYGWVLALLIVVAAAGFGGYEVWRQRQAQSADAVAAEFADALRQPAAQATPALERLAATAPEGYRTLARLRLADIKAQSNDLPGALSLWDAVAADAQADADLRGLANLLWAERQIDSGDPAAIEARLAPLADGNNTWHALAQEAQAILALKRGDNAGARSILVRLAADAGAPDDLRQRATLMLALPELQDQQG